MTSCVSLTSTFFQTPGSSLLEVNSVFPRYLRGKSNIHNSKLFLFIAPFHTKHWNIDMAHVHNNHSISCERMMRSNGEDPNHKEPNAMNASFFLLAPPPLARDQWYHL